MPTDQTPAAELSAAADLLDALAAAAMPGPWRYNPRKQWHVPEDLPRRRNGEEFVGAGPLDATVCVAATGPADEPQSMADARYIAAMNPTVGRAIAAWLRDTAGIAERMWEQHGADYGDDEATSLVADVYEQALDLARAVLASKEAAR
jgi:hypothetical protein